MSPYQRGIPDHLLQLSLATYQTTPSQTQWLKTIIIFIIAHYFWGEEFRQGLAGRIY